MKRILGLVTEAYGGRGGIAQATQDIVGAIASARPDIAIDLLVRLAPDPAIGAPATVNQAAPVAGRIAYALQAIAAVGRRPDLVFCNHLYMAPLARLVAQLAGARLVIQLHGIEIWSGLRPDWRRALEEADLMICVSRDTRRRALAQANLSPERTLVLNNTLDERFCPGDRKLARAKFGLADETVLLTVGRLSSRERYKGHDRVIAALPQLKSSGGAAVRYLIAGDGDDRARLESLARDLGVAQVVTFLGHVRDEDLPDLYRAADLFVMPSEGEGFGIAFVEAMGCGTPALGLAAGGAPDALGDGELGGCVAADALPDALNSLLNQPRESRVALSERVSERFGRGVFCSQVAAMLERLAPQRAVGAN